MGSFLCLTTKEIEMKIKKIIFITGS